MVAGHWSGVFHFTGDMILKYKRKLTEAVTVYASLEAMRLGETQNEIAYISHKETSNNHFEDHGETH